MTSDSAVAGTMPRSTRAGLLLATVCLCQVLVVLDVSVVNVALPSIDRALGFSAGDLSWVVNAYALAFGGLLLLGGRIADLVGHRKAMLSGLALFGIASLLGGFAQDPGQLVAARVGQGVAAAVLAPVSLTIIMVTFPDGPERRRAIGIWAMVAAMGSALGVLFGGLLTDLLNWRWVLFVNVPIVLATVALALGVVHDTRQIVVRRLDVTGAVLATAAATLLVYGTISAGDNGWTDPRTLVPLVGAGALAVLFWRWELRMAAAPLVRFGVFRTRTVWVANLIVMFIGAATVAGFYFASLFLQNVLGYDPLEAGLAFLPFCLGVVIGAISSSKLVTRVGYRPVMVGGLVIGALGMFLFSRLDADSTFLTGFMLPSIVASVGIGLAMVANTSLGTAGSAPEEAGLVSGLINTSRQLGGSVALAALATVAAHASRNASDSDPLDAVVTGYQYAFLTTAGLVALAAIVALLFTPALESPHHEQA